MFICEKYIPKLGSGVQELLGIKHELLEVSDVANTMLYRSHIYNSARLGGNQDRLQESCECIRSMVVHLQMHAVLCSSKFSDIHHCSDTVIRNMYIVGSPAVARKTVQLSYRHIAKIMFSM